MEKKIVSLILPCYNEEKIISSNITIVEEYIEKNIDKNLYDVRIVVVNDGSKDNTFFEVSEKHHEVSLVSYLPNHGKGYAVREGLRYSLERLNADYMIFMDADLSTDLKAINGMLNLFNQGHEYIVGSRYNKESNILVKQPLKRRIISVLSRIIISSMFRFGLKDTQCGFKGFDKEVAKTLVKLSKIDGFSFDVEYLYIAKLNHISYTHLPVDWTDHRDSRVSPLRSSIRFFKDLFIIKKYRKFYK